MCRCAAIEGNAGSASRQAGARAGGSHIHLGKSLRRRNRRRQRTEEETQHARRERVAKRGPPCWRCVLQYAARQVKRGAMVVRLEPLAWTLVCRSARRPLEVGAWDKSRREATLDRSANWRHTKSYSSVKPGQAGLLVCSVCVLSGTVVQPLARPACPFSRVSRRDSGLSCKRVRTAAAGTSLSQFGCQT